MADRRSVLRGLLLSAIARPVRAAPTALWTPDAMLARGEAELMRGDADAAMQTFERAAAQGHDARIELGMVRAAVQAGRYRQALGFAAHTAGEHARDAVCVSAYAGLLLWGGQADMARKLLLDARGLLPEADPGVALLDALLQELDRAWPRWPAGLRQGAARMVPHAHGDALPAHAMLLASGVLLMGRDGVQRVVTPAVPQLDRAARCLVRNGLGMTALAVPDPSVPAVPDAAALVRVWRVQGPSMPGEARLAARDAFPGSPVHAMAYALGAGPEPPATPSEAPWAQAAWPVLRMGFAGRVDPALGPLLGIDRPGGQGPWSSAEEHVNPLGGPVVNAQGRLVGIALAGAAGQAASADRLWPVSAMRRWDWLNDAAVPMPSAPNSAPRMPIDELYERGLRHTVQLIAAA